MLSVQIGILIAFGTFTSAPIQAQNSVQLPTIQVTGDRVILQGPEIGLSFGFDVGAWETSYDYNPNVTDAEVSEAICAALAQEQASRNCSSVLAGSSIANGCGPDWNLGWLNAGTIVPDAIEPENGVNVSIGHVCNAHDLCYDFPGSSRFDCDDQFNSALRSECGSPLSRIQYRNWAVNEDVVTPTYNLNFWQDELQNRCTGYADFYSGAVRTMAFGAWQRSQEAGICRRLKAAAQNAGCPTP